MSKNLTFMKVTNTKSIAKVQAHAKYIGFRSRENHQNDRGLFSRDKENGASYRKFTHDLSSRPSLKHSQSNKAFKVVFSWRENDARELDIHNEEKYKEIARSYVQQLEKEKGMKLDYIGAVHMKDDHPHIHLVISGVGQDKETGNDKRLRIDFREDVPNHKNFIDNEIGAERIKQDREIDNRLRGNGERTQDYDYNRYSRYSSSSHKDVTKDVLNQMERLGRDAQRKAEQGRQEQERETTRNSQRHDREEGRERER